MARNVRAVGDRTRADVGDVGMRNVSHITVGMPCRAASAITASTAAPKL